jgi:uncharacterized protein
MMRTLAATGIEIDVRVTPRASRNEIAGLRDGVLVVRVTAPPVDDAANRAVVRLLAKRAGVAPGRVRIVRGGRGRLKRIAIEGGDRETLRRLGG